MGEGKKVEADKTEKKKEEKKTQHADYATYLTDSLFLSSLSPGPGNYNPIDECIWNKIARETAERKGQVIGSKKVEGDKKLNDKKKVIKFSPGPGT